MKLWLIKDKKDRILGPYAEKEVCAFIKEGQFKGEEQISSYPSGKWKPLSSHSLFYDELLKALNQEEAENIQEEVEPTIVISKPVPKPKKEEKKKIKIKFFSKEDNVDEGDEEGEVIEMEDVEEAYSQKIKKVLLVPGLIVGALILVTALLFASSDNSNQQSYVQLLSPKIKKSQLHGKNKKKLKKTNAKTENWIKKVQNTFIYYFKDEVKHYLKTQDQLINILEQNPNIPEAYYHLCLVHLELWPFTRQNSKDRSILSKVFARVSQLDKGGIYSGMCNVVNAIINNQYEKALAYIDSSLAVISTSGESPAFFHYLKAVTLKKLKRTSEAISYLQSSYRLIPKWIKPYALEAQILSEAKNYSAAVKILKKITKNFPQHSPSQLQLGIIEYKHFKHLKKSEKRLNVTLSKNSEFINPSILVEAYITLSQILLKQKDRGAATKNVKKAYALDPSNEHVLKLIKDLGINNKITKTKVDTRQTIYRGDVLRNEGNCNEAQVFYEKAYKLDRNKNALAAIQMAQCYWQMGISGQAIQWLKKAIEADPERMEAYFLLADYLSKNYSFNDARDVLIAARQKNKNNYKVFKGFALLAFRQKDYKMTLAYAERSLKFYASDVGVYNILSKASRALKEHNKAYEYATRAVEEDVNDIEGQINFAIALGLAYGFSRGEGRFHKLIEIYPTVIEYRQALGEYYFNDEKYETALEIFLQIVKQNPKFKISYIYLGRIYSFYGERDKDSNKFQRAVQFLIKASLLDPSDPDPLFYMGQVYMRQKRYLQAENQFKKVEGLNRDYPLVYYYLGKINFLQDGEENLNRALKFAKIESQENPNMSLAYILSGDIYKKKAISAKKTSVIRRANYELCAKEYQKALKIRSKDIILYIGLMECYRGSGDLDSALQITDKLLNTPGMSGHPELYNQSGLIYEIKGDFVKAKASYQQYLSLFPAAPERARIEKKFMSK